MRFRAGALSLLTVLGPGGAPAQTWNSQLLPKINGKYTQQPVSFADRSWTLDDYSYVGYYLGTKSPGSVPCNPVTVTAVGDITTPLQAAIDQVGQAGGGIVRIPAGTFTVSGTVAIPYGNISIEGAGSGQTMLQIPSTYASQDPQSYDAVLAFGKKPGATNRGWIKGPVASNVSTVVHRGDMQIDADDASGINVGDWVVLQQFFWQALVDANSTDPDRWTANTSTDFAFTYLRRVTGKTGNRVFIDAPVPWDLDPANNPVTLRFTDGKMFENSGVKGLTIQFANNTDPSTGRPHGTAVYFEGVRNGWVYDVKVLNFPRNGIYLRWSARLTILDCWVQGAQDYGGNGYGYGYVMMGENVLIKRCHGEDTRHNFISSRALTSMLVHTQCTSVNATQPDDAHYSFEQAILWDKHTQQNGESIEALNRGDQSTGAYETLGSGVIWNFTGDGVKGRLAYGGAIYVKPSPNGQALVIGVNGAHKVYDNAQGNVSPFVQGELLSASPGLQVGTQATALKNVLYEGLYQPGLQPASLYEAQLRNRVGTPPADWINACGIPPSLNPGGVTNAASFLGGALTPGEMITLFGTGMGPSELTGLQLDGFGLVATSLGGTRVLINGSLAPLVYSQANQVSAVVPYEVAGNTTATVQVEYEGVGSNTVSLPMAGSAPGIFAALANGIGQGAILNQDTSPNSPGNPAPPGSVVSIYATGEGQTDPPGVDGQLNLAPPYPKPLGGVSVSIGGIDAPVEYAGAAPGDVAGVLQVNAQVPAGVTGGAVPVVLNVGGIASQARLTMAVR